MAVIELLRHRGDTAYVTKLQRFRSKLFGFSSRPMNGFPEPQSQVFAFPLAGPMRLPLRPQPADRPQPAQEPRMSSFVPLGQHRAGPFPIPVSFFTILLKNSYIISVRFEGERDIVQWYYCKCIPDSLTFIAVAEKLNLIQ